MCFSQKHASTVPLVLNPNTGYITPQFHILFDDWFATVATSIDQLPDFNAPEWASTFGESTYQYPIDETLDDNETDSELTADPHNAELTSQQNQRQNTVAAAMDTNSPLVDLPTPPPPTMAPVKGPSIQTPDAPSTPTFPTREQVPDPKSPTPLQTPHSPLSQFRLPPTSSATRETRAVSLQSSTNSEPSTAVPPQPPALPPRSRPPIPTMRTNPPVARNQPSTSTSTTLSDPPQRRSQRERKPPERIGFDGSQGFGYYVHPQAWVFPICGLMQPPPVLKASPSDPDTLSFDEAMKDTIENVDKWMQAAAKEFFRSR